MARYRWDKEGKLVTLDEWYALYGNDNSSSTPAILGDITPFKSSVDGTVIGSRKDLREHNTRNGVVNTDDLSGLPPKKTASEFKHSESDRREMRERLSYQLDQQRR